MSERYYFLDVLKKLLTDKQERNSRYSLRSFARFLGLDPGSVSRILSQEKIPTLNIALKLTKNLDLNYEGEKQFFHSVLEANIEQRRYDEVELLYNYLNNFRRVREVTVKEFETCSTWMHEAVFVLLKKNSYRKNIELIQKDLDIPYGILHQVIRDLVKVGFVKEEGGTLSRISEDLSFNSIPKDHVNNIKKRNDLLDHSERALFNDDIAIRNHSYMTFNMDPNKSNELQEVFEEFFEEIESKHSDDKSDELYEFNLGFVPLSTSEDGKALKESILEHFLATTDEKELEFIKNQKMFSLNELPELKL
ncbi:DUF4423 domain-containing protein [Bacteriovoracaceae bacterium]|nr:DUF4423 domain-containing protein [Bacteriovoracaceae bacterium]